MGRSGFDVGGTCPGEEFLGGVSLFACRVARRVLLATERGMDLRTGGRAVHLDEACLQFMDGPVDLPHVVGEHRG